ncbi:hypothetical protein [Hydrogenophaga sp. PML113]|uniref:hypothetical protein n=1 Tax=Hydrogenophaga sp. PML113 TaxID=1899350 RepID=UPI000878DC96|nr:hypothetical protein [Hydrogenophaga sp. PML113]
MIVSNGRLSMSQDEWLQFQQITRAPWQPRTPREFNAMCELGAAHHRVENTDGEGWSHEMACEDMKFGPDGQINFPADQRRLAYVKVHGTWPTDEQLREFEGQPKTAGPGLTVVR